MAVTFKQISDYQQVKQGHPYSDPDTNPGGDYSVNLDTIAAVQEGIIVSALIDLQEQIQAQEEIFRGRSALGKADVCECCGGLISEERRSVLPYTTICRDCKQ